MILDTFPTIMGLQGPGPLFRYRSNSENLRIQFFRKSPQDCSHWNCDSGLGGGIGLKSYPTVVEKNDDFDVSGPEHVSETQRICF